MISVIIITKNEEDRIKNCLESVKWADEIIVADNGSIDSTLEIAKLYTKNIIEFHDKDFGSLRNKATEVATGDWILYVDADERVSRSLKDEVLLLITNNEFSAFAISRKNIIFGEQANFAPFKPDWVIRLVKKSAFDTWVGKVHEYLKFNGKLGYSKSSLIHLTHRGVEAQILKNLEWSKIDAKLMIDASHPKMVGWRFLRITFTEFFKYLFFKGWIFKGSVGIIEAILQTFSRVVSYIRLWEMQKGKTMKEIYQEIDNKLAKNNFEL